jgi:hypothetical protein
MSPCQDERFTRALAAPCCRRTVLRALGGGLVGAVLGGFGSGRSALAGTQRDASAAALGPAAKATGRELAAQQPARGPALLVYDTAQGLLAGDLQHAVSMERIRHDLSTFSPDWSVVGVGTTNQPGHTGELIPDGTAGALRFWWADPSSPSQADVSDLSQTAPSGEIEFPFLAIGVADAFTPLTWPLEDAADVHAWLKDRLAYAAIPLAAIQLEGSFGPVMTTVSYNIPPTGIDTSAGYVGSQYFRFGSYPSGSWRMNGVYAAAAALQPVISTAGNPLHLHGYQPGPMLGGHIVSAAPRGGIAKVWILDELIVQPAPLAPEAVDSGKETAYALTQSFA